MYAPESPLITSMQFSVRHMFLKSAQKMTAAEPLNVVVIFSGKRITRLQVSGAGERQFASTHKGMVLIHPPTPTPLVKRERILPENAV